MDMNLTLNETRVIGCLIEKQVTTPDQYPLSLNALTNACNQKSNREPIMDLSEATVQETLDGLKKKHLISEQTGYGSRVPKYLHRFCNTEFGELKFTKQEQGMVCVLLLRGPQTPGELRTRTNRLCTFADVHETEAVLQGLIDKAGGPFVVKLPREPGKRESRYAHLFSGEVDASQWIQAAPTAGASQSDRLGDLEAQVAEMREEIDLLKSRLADLLD